MVSKGNLKILASLAFLAGCGSHNDDSPKAQENPVQSQEISQAPQSLSFENAQLVETTAQIADCNGTNLRALIYVIENAQFYYCSTKQEWVAIDLRGAKGDKGDKGDTGSTGSSGSSGRNGSDGQNGRSAIASNEWEDPVSGSKWFLGRYISPADVARESTICPAASHSATDSEIELAIGRGIFTKLSSNFVSNNIAILRTELVSTDRWKVTYATADSLRVTSNQITLADYSTSLSSFWTTKAYILCVVN